jgi:hypothetical protein
LTNEVFPDAYASVLEAPSGEETEKHTWRPTTAISACFEKKRLGRGEHRGGERRPTHPENQWRRDAKRPGIGERQRTAAGQSHPSRAKDSFRMNRLGRPAARLRARLSPARLFSAAPETTPLEDALQTIPQVRNGKPSSARKTLQELRAMLEADNLSPEVEKMIGKMVKRKERAELYLAKERESKETPPHKTAPALWKKAAKADQFRQPKEKPDSKTTSFVAGWGQDGTRINVSATSELTLPRIESSVIHRRP